VPLCVIGCAVSTYYEWLFENEDTAKSDCFIISTLFQNEWEGTSLYFMKGVPAS